MNRPQNNKPRPNPNHKSGQQGQRNRPPNSQRNDRQQPPRNQNQANQPNRGRPGQPQQNRNNPQNKPAPKEQKPELPPDPIYIPTPPKKYGVIFFDSFLAAKASVADITAAQSKVDQLNIVIKADGDMDDPDLTKYGRVFAGDAWYLINERRVAENWYDDPH